jgi:hypothetical protein
VADDDVIFNLGNLGNLGPWTVRVSRTDAKEISGRLVELSEPWVVLKPQFTRALGPDAEERVVATADPGVLLCLLDIIRAAEQDARLGGLQDLREAAQAAIETLRAEP